MENSGGSLKRQQQLPGKQIRRSNGGGSRTTNAGCSRNWSAKICFMFFFLAYVSLGAYVFMLIEASSSASSSMNQFTPPTEEIRTALSGTSTSSSSEQQQPTTTAANHNEGDVTQMKELMTRQVLDKLWDITENLNILYKENWTRLAAGEIYRFHETMHLWMKNDCNNNRRKSQQEMTAVIGGQHQTTTADTSPAAGANAGQHRHKTVKWNYPTAFLYALSVITTLGKWSLKGLGILLLLQPSATDNNNLQQIHRNNIDEFNCRHSKLKSIIMLSVYHHMRLHSTAHT